MTLQAIPLHFQCLCPPCAPTPRRAQGSCCPGWGLPEHPQCPQSLCAARRSSGSVSRLWRCPAEGHGSSWLLCPALGTCRGRSSRPGLLPTEMAFLESSACCRLAAPAVPWPSHQRCHQPEGELEGAQQCQDSFHPCPGADDPQIRPAAVPSCVWV